MAAPSDSSRRGAPPTPLQAALAVLAPDAAALSAGYAKPRLPAPGALPADGFRLAQLRQTAQTWARLLELALADAPPEAAPSLVDREGHHEQPHAPPHQRGAVTEDPQVATDHFSFEPHRLMTTAFRRNGITPHPALLVLGLHHLQIGGRVVAERHLLAAPHGAAAAWTRPARAALGWIGWAVAQPLQAALGAVLGDGHDGDDDGDDVARDRTELTPLLAPTAGAAGPVDARLTLADLDDTARALQWSAGRWVHYARLDAVAAAAVALVQQHAASPADHVFRVAALFRWLSATCPTDGTPCLQHAWPRLTADDRVRLVDHLVVSGRAAREGDVLTIASSAHAAAAAAAAAAKPRASARIWTRAAPHPHAVPFHPAGAAVADVREAQQQLAAAQARLDTTAQAARAEARQHLRAAAAAATATAGAAAADRSRRAAKAALARALQADQAAARLAPNRARLDEVEAQILQSEWDAVTVSGLAAARDALAVLHATVAAAALPAGTPSGAVDAVDAVADLLAEVADAHAQSEAVTQLIIDHGAEPRPSASSAAATAGDAWDLAAIERELDALLEAETTATPPSRVTVASAAAVAAAAAVPAPPSPAPPVAAPSSATSADGAVAPAAAWPAVPTRPVPTVAAAPADPKAASPRPLLAA
ncbi:hypothetical protein CXG81DRAFT_17362 [Caulochytrium protostelioides]|uniref:Uncharacterized protein n=1 Tax=Caulochytrium protostelioides TaxID=1555241 RepID=A0A4P9XC62_9FUNG|nr:hypothetical protein CXG81DRAFT_17362 [Caulochytrium protostelioides]|eukprot:RKP03005.1 hypothetical protein CXG81DRAFT_17362 [Caulochytrium protostelioides]